MPIMDVRYAAGALDATAKANLARRLTEVLIQMEGGANTPAGRAFAWVFFTAFAAEDVWVGGEATETRTGAAGRFLVNIFIPEGYMNVAHKDEVHAWVAAAIAGATGATPPGNGILTVINEVTEGNWGHAGHPISLESIASAVGQAADGPRMHWSRAYFAAKARAMTAARFPADTGGMLPSLRPAEAGAPDPAVAG